MKTAIATISFLTLGLLGASAADIKPSDYDKDGDGKLDFEELISYALKAVNPKYSELNVNPNNRGVTDQEIREWFRQNYWDDAIPDSEQLEIEPDLDAKTTFERALTLVPPSPKNWGIDGLSDPTKGLGELRLRESHSDLTKGIKKASPASFGWYDNFGSGEETWATQATLGLVRQFDDPENPVTIGNYVGDPLQFIPSVSVDRITGKGDGSLKEADALVFRSGLTWGLQQDSGNPIWDAQFLSANVRSAGKTSGDDFKTGFEFVWEPVRDRTDDFMSIGGGLRAIDPNKVLKPKSALFLYRIPFSMRIEVGEPILDNEDDPFAKIGPTIGFDLEPQFLPRLSLFANYSYLWEVGNQSEDFDYLETGGRWAVDQAEQVFFEVKYRYGQVPARFTEIDIIQASLAIKF